MVAVTLSELDLSMSKILKTELKSLLLFAARISSTGNSVPVGFPAQRNSVRRLTMVNRLKPVASSSRPSASSPASRHGSSECLNNSRRRPLRNKTMHPSPANVSRTTSTSEKSKSVTAAADNNSAIPVITNKPPISGSTGLVVLNSLTRKKDPFHSKNGKTVKWYSCGPTVYDSSHMGHARTYISFDIIRRIMEDYFGYGILYCMNITDIDDKIIKRARENHLFNEYRSNRSAMKNLSEDAALAIKYITQKSAAEEDPDKKAMYTGMIERAEKIYKDKLEHKNSGDGKQEIIDSLKDVLSDWLDYTRGRHVQDNSVFAALPRKFEAEFHEDMDALNIRPANVITRVSEYVNEIINFIKVIIKNGFGYVSNSSVYFDTEAFRRSKCHRYAKLKPEAVGDLKSLAEGEGSLSEGRLGQKDEKKCPCDFALWKSSKHGEPSWESPWGKGRPGWHIECSAMASEILGQEMDIHSGGVDLKFPHHDNEIAQSEAAFNHDQWIRYFLHSGHLTIQGCKMSKSLKNFITIKQCLQNYNFRHVRLLFLMHTWHDTLDFSDHAMIHAKQYEKMANEFFLLVKDIIRSGESNDPAIFTKWTKKEFELNQKFVDCQVSVHNALSDSFDTPAVLESLRSLISASYVYMNDKSIVDNKILLRSIAVYVDKIFRIFGLMRDNDYVFGFDSASSTTSLNKEAVVMPFLKVLADFRENVRSIAKENKVNALLKLCDDLRDVQLLELGIKLEDKDSRTVIKMYDAEELKQEKERGERMIAESKEKEKLRQDAVKESELEKQNQKSIPPSELFKSNPLYSKFDDNGFPIADKDGNELTKSAVKKLRKIYQLQENRYKEWLQYKVNRGDK